VAREPRPPSQPARWTIYRAAKKAIRADARPNCDERKDFPFGGRFQAPGPYEEIKQRKP
jgi:hypothetical protein